MHGWSITPDQNISEQASAEWTDLHRERAARQVHPAAGDLQPVEPGTTRRVGTAQPASGGLAHRHRAVGAGPVRQDGIQRQRGCQPLAVAAVAAIKDS